MQIELRGNIPPARNRVGGYEECKLVYLGNGNSQLVSNPDFVVNADISLAISIAERLHEKRRVDSLKEKFRRI